ncbi:hypothetical protein COCC4DRAFT_31379 [Bipolaris maydis ATCC 48331]|uniref:Uncharacterized protein n=2 Tax=Cochliobolus heterostrophus TaxID=5016 RepID=M2TLU8_COCH5|nr:uncharacterized protein COCC4DRAFT_31379 [Bipolaris maydis ATCC 48331]EMD87489.1 hypothetical protein COCHEDRAFT_1023574 [Bipolaris maydis C5]ENI06688.1 hypothetical protein COCC4DRAFT_31379 [Bipolaris maydis ATCC 48331]
MPTHVEPYETLEGALPHRSQAHGSEADSGQAVYGPHGFHFPPVRHSNASLRTPVAVSEAARNEFGSLGIDGAWHVQDNIGSVISAPGLWHV